MCRLLAVLLMLGVAGTAMASVDTGNISPSHKDPGART